MIDWNQATGTISGDHWAVDALRQLLDDTERAGRIGDVSCYWLLPDPKRDPAQFLRTASLALGRLDWDPDGLPAALRAVQITPAIDIPLLHGEVA